jgi:hypothetical protein
MPHPPAPGTTSPAYHGAPLSPRPPSPLRGANIGFHERWPLRGATIGYADILRGATIGYADILSASPPLHVADIISGAERGSRGTVGLCWGVGGDGGRGAVR